MRGPVAKKEQLDEVHRRYFISGHYLHLKQLALLPYKLANSKQDLELKKLQKTKMREDIKYIQLTNEIAQLQKRSLQLDIFNKENEILWSHGLAQKPASEVLPMQVQTLTIGVPDKAQQPQFTYTLSSATITPSAVPSESVIAGEMSVTAEGLLNCIDAGITELSIEESAGNSDTSVLHLEILKTIINGEKFVDKMKKVWCKPYTKNMHQFAQDNNMIALGLEQAEEVLTLGKMSTGKGGFTDYSCLSMEMPNIYSFINKRAEFDDNEI